MCKKQSTDVYEMRKDINELRTQQGLPSRDIGEPPVFEDPFAAHDAAMAAWYAAQEGGTYVEEEEEVEVAPARPHRRPRRCHGKDPIHEKETEVAPAHPPRRPRRRHGKDPIEEEEEEVQAEESEEEEEADDNDDDDDASGGNRSEDEEEEDE